MAHRSGPGRPRLRLAAHGHRLAGSGSHGGLAAGRSGHSSVVKLSVHSFAFSKQNSALRCQKRSGRRAGPTHASQPPVTDPHPKQNVGKEMPATNAFFLGQKQMHTLSSLVMGLVEIWNRTACAWANAGRCPRLFRISPEAVLDSLRQAGQSIIQMGLHMGKVGGGCTPPPNNGTGKMSYFPPVFSQIKCTPRMPKKCE